VAETLIPSRAAPPGALSTLFLDMNSYFASVEQQLRPELRGRPVAVVAVEAETTAVIAASIEAKPFGVRTGTPVWKARRECPGLTLVKARPMTYVEFHDRIKEAVETVLPVDAVHSIDEMSCRLLGEERRPERAVALAKEAKRAIRGRAGEWMRCSVGIAPNRFLAKVAADMRKPDGLTVLTAADLPHALFGLKLDDLPGVGPRMLRRLNGFGVRTVEQLCGLPEPMLRAVWRGVVGTLWWHRLRGADLRERTGARRTVGHSHVLAPQRRTDDGARAVLIRLLDKAAARLRRLGCWARRLTVEVRGVRMVGDDRPKWKAEAKFPACQDTLTLMQAMLDLWGRRRSVGVPLKVGVTLSDLQGEGAAAEPLFEADRRRLRLSRCMDRLNNKLGRYAVHFAGMQEALHAAPPRIAFGSIPEPEFDSRRAGGRGRPGEVTRR
jgi:DNA polymerase-4